MKPHNPDNLTREQVGVSEGWRLLDEDELNDHRISSSDIERWMVNSRSWSGGYSGGSESSTYRTTLTRQELASLETVDDDENEGGGSDHYAFSYKGLRLDPYRIELVCGPWHPAQAHAIKKLMRAGKSVKPLVQDIDESIAALNRWKQMIQEDAG